MIIKCKNKRGFLKNINKDIGFTLIELLAVIIILAVIIVITVPIILNVTENSKKQAAKDSAYGYIKAVEYNNSLGEFNDKYTKLSDGTYRVSELNPKINLKGNKATYGNVKIEKGKITNANLCIGGYMIDYDKKKVSIGNKCIETEDTTGPDIIIGAISGTTNSLTIPFTVQDLETGIESIECFYSLDKSYKNKGKIEDDTCKLTKLENHKTYNFKIEVVNNAGQKSEATGSNQTGNFNEIEMTLSSTGWASSKIVTISGSTEGAALQYKIVSGTTVKQNWTTYSNAITIDWAANTNEPTYIYARFYDGTNTSNEETLTITTVDVTGPTLTFGSITSTTKNITISFSSNSDSESGITSTICKYGTSNGSYTETGTVNSDKTSCTINGKQDTTYFYQVTTTNGAGMSKTVTGNTKTEAFSAIEIKPNTTGWTTSKTVTISGNTSGATLQYKIVSGTTVKQNWTTYSNTITIDWAANTDIPTYIYARFYDGTNYSDEETLTITTVDVTGPTLTLGTATSTTKAIVVPINENSDSESGIKSTTCSYGTSTSYGSNGTIGTNNCSLTGLKNNTTYYYSITTTNNAGTEVTRTGNFKTGQFAGITITPSSTSWTTSKTVTISGNTSGATLQYKVVSGTTLKTDWTTYSGAITINWAANTTTPTYVYARFNDGTNTSNEETLTITTVDTTSPTTASLTAESKTDRVTLTATCTDNESGISKYEYSKDNGSSWVTGESAAYVFTGLNQGTNYNFKVKCTNGVGLTKQGSLDKSTSTIVAPTLTTTSDPTLSKDITVTYDSTNIVSPVYYVKGTIASTISVAVTQSCGTSTNPGTCTTITSTTSLKANTWYKVTNSNVKLTITDNGSFYAATSDGKNLKAGSTLTVTSIVKTASEIYYNNSTYTNGQDITVQEAIEDLYNKLK